MWAVAHARPHARRPRTVGLICACGHSLGCLAFSGVARKYFSVFESSSTTTTTTYFRLASHVCSIVRARAGIASSQPSGLSSRGRGITSERALLGAPLSSSSESSVANLAASGVSSGCAQPAPIRRFGGERGSRRFDPTSSERERFLAEPEMVLAAPCRARLWLSARFFAPALVLSARARGVKQRTLSRESLPEPRPGPPDLECPRGVTVLVMCLSTLSPASKEPCCDSYSISQCTCDRARAPAR